MLVLVWIYAAEYLKDELNNLGFHEEKLKSRPIK